MFYFGLFKKILRLLTKYVTPMCKLFFPKCLVALGKGSTWEKGDGKFHVWTYFTICFTLCFIFLRVCPKDDPPFEIRRITRIIYYICCSVYTFINILIEHSGCIKNISSCICVYIYIYIYIRANYEHWGLGARFLEQISKKRAFCLLATRN